VPAGFGVVYKIDPTDWAVDIVHAVGNGRDGVYSTGRIAGQRRAYLQRYNERVVYGITPLGRGPARTAEV
jgi:hypothetical protein